MIYKPTSVNTGVSVPSTGCDIDGVGVEELLIDRDEDTNIVPLHDSDWEELALAEIVEVVDGVEPTLKDPVDDLDIDKEPEKEAATETLIGGLTNSDGVEVGVWLEEGVTEGVGLRDGLEIVPNSNCNWVLWIFKLAIFVF